MILGPDGRPYRKTASAIAPRDFAKPGYMGVVEVKGVWDEPGHPDHGKVVEYHKHNTITYDARKVMARAIAGDNAGHIVTVGWGTDDTAAQRSDTALFNQVITSAVVMPVTYPPDDQSVVFTSVLVRGTGTGYTYKEAGLISQGGLLFARFVFPTGIYKFPQLRLTVNWQIIFI